MATVTRMSSTTTTTTTTMQRMSVHILSNILSFVIFIIIYYKSFTSEGVPLLCSSRPTTSSNSCRRAWTRAGVISCPRDCWGASSTCWRFRILPPRGACTSASRSHPSRSARPSPRLWLLRLKQRRRPPPPPELRVVMCLGRQSGNGLCLLATSPWERTASSTGRDGQTGRVNACSESYFDFLEKRVLSSSRKIEREVLEDFAIKGGMGVGVCRLH
jgi:hypothetical protein